MSRQLTASRTFVTPRRTYSSSSASPYRCKYHQWPTMPFSPARSGSSTIAGPVGLALELEGTDAGSASCAVAGRLSGRPAASTSRPTRQMCRRSRLTARLETSWHATTRQLSTSLLLRTVRDGGSLAYHGRRQFAWDDSMLRAETSGTALPSARAHETYGRDCRLPPDNSLATSAGQHHDTPGAIADDHAAIGTD